MSYHVQGRILNAPNGSFTLNIHELWLRLFGGEELVQRKIHVELAIGQLD